MKIRIAYSLFILCSVLFVPWQTTFLFLLAGIFLIDRWWESLLWAVFIDVVLTGGVSDPHYFMTIMTVLMYIVINNTKEYLSWYDKVA